MRLVRFVDDPEEWRKALIARDKGEGAFALHALRAFTPTLREQKRISLFRLEPKETPERLAAAWWLTQKESFALIAVEEDELRAAGAAFDEKVKGTTYHPSINDKHVDLIVNDADEAVRYARVFYEKGKLLPVEIREIQRSIANDNKKDLIDFKRLTDEKKDPSPKKLCDVINKGSLLLKSPPRPRKKPCVPGAGKG